jgi:hypothetical protein
MSDPGFNFFADNFMGATYLWTDAEVGQYMRALCLQKLNGHLSFDDLNTVVKGNQKILNKFCKDEKGLYFNVRLQKEIEKRSHHSQLQSDRASKRWENNNAAVLPRHESGNACNGIGIGIGIETDIDNEFDSNSKSRVFIKDHRECSELLKKRVQERRQAKIDEKRLVEWDRDVRLMIERDNRTLEQITELINECHDMEPTKTGFSWRDNILLMSTLRKRWNEGKIAIGMNKKSNQPPKKETGIPEWKKPLIEAQRQIDLEKAEKRAQANKAAQVRRDGTGMQGIENILPEIIPKEAT